ncbi:putative methyltransferase [Bacillus chungangensis]|uniref:Methyltransferase n=2 Tax=Bacillus chungangensis TaxID=587633 RepID=A0ABT9WUC4_9BACI|nr:putative methyltransferase [Bacillus chungangensis]
MAMALERILPFAKSLLKKAAAPGDIVIDATIGNGHDTCFLAELVGEQGHVYGFDIQAEAIQQTTKKLAASGLLERVTLFQQGHETVLEVLPSDVHGKLAGAIFNLGYLPGGNKSIVTLPHTTISALLKILSILKTAGIVVLVIYPGHDEGQNERDVLLEEVKNIDQQQFHVLQYQFINQKNNPPFVIAIEKR